MSSSILTVVGLGNPGPRYDATRHNIGFAVVDLLRSLSGIAEPSDVHSEALRSAGSALAGGLSPRGWMDRGDFLESSVSIGAWSASLIKPMTFMNRSGEPLQQFLHFRKIPISNVVVVHDEIDLPFGAIRVKVDGGEGGHNGLRSISDHCGGRGYARIRMGVGKPPANSPLAGQPDGIATWVLNRFSEEERPFAEEMVQKGVEAVVLLALKGLRVAQNRFNGGA